MRVLHGSTYNDKLMFIGGFHNFIYSYNHSGDKFILRFTLSTLRTLQQSQAELEWIQHLAGNGVSFSEPVCSAQGNNIEHVQGELAGLPVLKTRAEAAV